MSDYVMRRAAADDSSALFTLHRAAFGAYVEAIFGPWDPAVQTRLHREWFDPDRLWVIESDRQLVGVVYYFYDDHLELSRISIHPDHQNKGIGSAVLHELLEEADRRQLATSLEVFEINPARRLYARLGFVEVSQEGHKIQMIRNAKKDRRVTTVVDRARPGDVLHDGQRVTGWVGAGPTRPAGPAGS